MANKLYPKTKAQMGQGAFNWLTSDIRAIIVDSASYTYADAHEFLTDIVSGARTAVSSSLTGKSITAATAGFKSDEKTLGSVTGAVSEAVVLYAHTGSDATARLIAYIDTGVTGLPVTPDGRDIKLTPNAAGWFTL